MKIKEVDPNFVINREPFTENGVRYYSIPNENFALYGVYYDKKREKFVRLDREIAKKVNAGVRTLSEHTAGGRLRFSTDSDVFVLQASYDYLGIKPHMAIEGQGGFALLEEKEDDVELVQIFPPTPKDKKGFTLSCHLPRGMRNYILHFPLYNPINSLTIGLDESASVAKGKEYRSVKKIIYYGSSITQGGCASRPDNAYQGLIAKWNNIDFLNFGFSGNAKGERTMADFLGEFDCSLFVCDYDHNAPSPEYLQQTHYAFYECYRKKQPNVPILFMNRPDYYGKKTDRERAKVVRETYRKARANGDENVYFLSGKTFFNKDKVNCMVDGCHPNDLGFYLMAKKIYKKMIEIDEIFK